jgi:nicotinamidase/pyrazinamidase
MSSPGTKLRGGWAKRAREDLALAHGTPPLWQADAGSLTVLPDAAWAVGRRSPRQLAPDAGRRARLLLTAVKEPGRNCTTVGCTALRTGATMERLDSIGIGPGDALLVVDLQLDFLPGGALPVPGGDEIVPLVNDYVQHFAQHRRPVYATRDWHPPRHCSFEPAGPWPVHCVAGASGAAFARDLVLTPGTIVVSKAQEEERDAYSGFAGTSLERHLRAAGIHRVFVAGLATDYCVLHTVEDALALGFAVVLLLDALRAVDLHAGDGAAAIARMRALGAGTATRADLLLGAAPAAAAAPLRHVNAEPATLT